MRARIGDVARGLWIGGSVGVGLFVALLMTSPIPSAAPRGEVTVAAPDTVGRTRVPQTFEENVGQTDTRVRFLGATLGAQTTRTLTITDGDPTAAPPGGGGGGGGGFDLLVLSVLVGLIAWRQGRRRVIRERLPPRVNA